jgi:hypothetical protein
MRGHAFASVPGGSGGLLRSQNDSEHFPNIRPLTTTLTERKDREQQPR